VFKWFQSVPPGLSPRMWGTPFRLSRRISWMRFIPTHVGNTSPPPCCQSPGTVYPHVCGEHPEDEGTWISVSGLSPRMWGTRGYRRRDAGTPRFIPRMWGAHILAELKDILWRFIPTYVGNTFLSSSVAIPISVYPHVCGEHLSRRGRYAGKPGLSPRMWGTRIQIDVINALWRFIPTYVGNTERFNIEHPPQPVYPHVCGEHGRHRTEGHMQSGLSPRMWGTHREHKNKWWPLRFIPTYVGNTQNAASLLQGRAVYPHVCGERIKIEEPMDNSCGLSPRMWGTLERGDTDQDGGRFIPTYVGNAEIRRRRRGWCIGLSPRMWGTRRE